MAVVSRFGDVDEVDWTAGPFCNRCRARPAELLLQGELACVDCADVVVERLAALELAPALRELLEPLPGFVRRQRPVAAPAPARGSSSDRVGWFRPPLQVERPWFGVCYCGHGVDRHGRFKPPGTPHFEYGACGVELCPCGSWRPSDGSSWPNGPALLRFPV